MNPRTTLAGFITALITVAFWVINSWFYPIPTEVTTFVITGAIALVTLFADPNSFKEVKPNIFAVITTLITITGYVLQAVWKIQMPDFIIPFLQAISIFLFGLFLRDTETK